MTGQGSDVERRLASVVLNLATRIELFDECSHWLDFAVICSAVKKYEALLLIDDQVGVYELFLGCLKDSHDWKERALHGPFCGILHLYGIKALFLFFTDLLMNIDARQLSRG